MDRTLFQMKLKATTRHVALVERDLEAVRQPADALAGARENARNAALGLAELYQLFNEMLEPPQAMRDCPACGKGVNAAATRCGFCWTRLTADPRG